MDLENEKENGRYIGEIKLVKTKINIKDISFDIGRYKKNMMLIAIGDSDGYLSIFSLLTLTLLVRIKVQNDNFDDIAVM